MNDNINSFIFENLDKLSFAILTYTDPLKPVEIECLASEDPKPCLEQMFKSSKQKSIGYNEKSINLSNSENM